MSLDAGNLFVGRRWRDLFRGGGPGSNLIRVQTVPPRLWKAKDDEDERDEDHGDVEPPEALPAGGRGHGAVDDWSNHEGAHVCSPVDCIPESTIVQEKDVGNDGRLDGFCRAGTDTVEDTRTHEAVVATGLCSPYHGCQADELRGDVDKAAAKGGA